MSRNLQILLQDVEFEHLWKMLKIKRNLKSIEQLIMKNAQN